MLPIVGEVFDLANAGIYYLEGDYLNAGLSAASAIPLIGNYVTGAKWGKKAVKVGGTASGLGKQVAKHADDAPGLLKRVANGLTGCFTEGTQIVVGMEYDPDDNFVSYVTMNIEDVKVGDLVYSYNTLTGETELCAVTSTLAKTSDHINYLTIIDENGVEQVIESTDVHPFWVVTDEPDLSRAARSVVDENGILLYHENLESGLNGYWVEAKDLHVGDVFLGVNGEFSVLTNIVRVEQEGGIGIFNFTVEGNHNYFILSKDYDYGQTCVLVHNNEACGVYALKDRHTGDIVRTGRTNNFLRREAEHLRDPNLKKYEFAPLYHTDVYAEQRGLEQLAHELYKPPLNKINPISPTNPNRPAYIKAAQNYQQ